jgi:hypothetical protein
MSLGVQPSPGGFNGFIQTCRDAAKFQTGCLTDKRLQLQGTSLKDGFRQAKPQQQGSSRDIAHARGEA